MEEHDRLEDESSVVVQTLELMLIALGLVVIGSLGSPVLMPMMFGLILFFPCAFAVHMVQHHGARSRR